MAKQVAKHRLTSMDVVSRCLEVEAPRSTLLAPKASCTSPVMSSSSYK